MYMNHHDALRGEVGLDVRSGTARIALTADPDEHARERRPYVLTFTGVTEFTTTVDLAEIARHAVAGTVVAVRKQRSGRITYIYLTGGLISIHCASMTEPEVQHQTAGRLRRKPCQNATQPNYNPPPQDNPDDRHRRKPDRRRPRRGEPVPPVTHGRGRRGRGRIAQCLGRDLYRRLH